MELSEWIIIALCVLSLLFAWFMVYGEARGLHIQTYLAKTLASICFVSAGFVAAVIAKDRGYLIFLLLGGLVFGMLGDIFLCRVQIAREEFWEILLNAGGAFFLAGHLCYFIACLFMSKEKHVAPYILVPLLLILVFTLMKSGKWKIDKKNWFNYMGYGTVSGLMLSSAVEIMIETPGPEEIVLAVAAFTFILSDLALATWNYGRFHTVWMRYTCITLYYVAQILFVVGIWIH